MIVSLKCEHFKCFRDTGPMELAPLTLLVGPNNSGKSAIIQALHLPALTVRSEDPAICLKLLHKDYDYGSFKDVVFRHREYELVTLSFKAPIAFEVQHEDKSRMVQLDATLRLTYGYLPRRKEIYLNGFVLEDSNGKRLEITQHKYTSSNKTVWMRNHEKDSMHLLWVWERRGLSFEPRLDPFKTIKRLRTRFDKKTTERVMREIVKDYTLIDGFISNFRKIYHLGPLRIPASRTYLYSGELTDTVGARGQFALQNYSALLKRGKREDLRRVKSINRALYQLGFIRTLSVEQIGSRHYEFWTRHKESSFPANLADTGFGASQVFPVIVSLYTSPPGSTLLYEQPEIHLHPQGQAELGAVFANACSPDRRIVVETHSEPFILRIQTQIALGNLTPNDVKIYYVQPDKKGHRVIPIRLNAKGEFLDEWPTGFFEETYDESLRLSKARHGG